ncbi:unnamed protein product [Linum tenue]|uniref:Uncharacterized protein n=1 Tax=Linum tenue TaxID=586396 RepID=A0AAV0PXQ0_9ROSI|nr:unnamed protein product [Linum tenue]
MASEISDRVTELFREITSDLYSNSPASVLVGVVAQELSSSFPT